MKHLRSLSIIAGCAAVAAAGFVHAASPFAFDGEIYLVAAVLLLPLIALLAQPLYRRGSFHVSHNTISAQCQATGLSFQYGHYLVGWFAKSWLQNRRGGLGPTRIIVAGPETGSGRVYFQLLVLGHGLSFASPTPRGNSSWSWPGPGARLV